MPPACPQAKIGRTVAAPATAQAGVSTVAGNRQASTSILQMVNGFEVRFSSGQRKFYSMKFFIFF
jgi:hypothetical protein